MGSALTGSAAAFAVTLRRGCQIDAAADRVHAGDAHVDGVAQAHRRAGALAVEDRALLVQLPPLAPAVAVFRAQQPDGEHALEPRPGALVVLRRGAGARPGAGSLAGARPRFPLRVDAEGDERAGGDEPGDLAGERLLVAALVQQLLEREAAGDVV